MLGCLISITSNSQELSAILDDPQENIDANESIFYSSYTLATYPSNWYEYDHPIYRIAEDASILYLAMAATYFSHEYAHNRIIGSRKICWNDRTMCGFPKFTKKEYPYTPNYEDTFKNLYEKATVGLNQNAFNYRECFFRSNSNLDIIQSFWYLSNALTLICYRDGYNISQHSYELEDTVIHSMGDRGGDLKSYIISLDRQNIKTTTTRIKQLHALSLIANYRIWECLWIVFNQLYGNKTTYSPHSNWTPHITHFLARTGNFFVCDIPYNPLLLSFGHDVDSLSNGKVNCLRFGMEIPYQIKDLTITGIGYIDTERCKFAYTGSSIGMKIGYKISKYELFLKYQYNDHDVFENDILQEPRHKVLLGANYTF